MLIGDGDVAGVIATSQPDTGIDIYLGSGGAPEGVLAAAALRCIGGQMQGRLLFEDDEQIERARTMGITDPNRIYTIEEMAKGDVMFAATGVTGGPMLRGVRRDRAWRGDAFDRDAQQVRHGALSSRRTIISKRRPGRRTRFFDGVLGIENSLTGRRWVWRAGEERVGLGHGAAAGGAGDDRAAAGRARRDARTQAPDFLEPTLRALLPDPSCLVDMDVAAARLADAVRGANALACSAITMWMAPAARR